MKEQVQPESSHKWRYTRNIVQASVALIVLTAALWIGWWPDMAVVPNPTGNTGQHSEGQSPAQLADGRMLDQLGQETSHQKIKPLSRGSQLLINEEKAVATASSDVPSSETELVTPSLSASTTAGQTTTTQTRQTKEIRPETTAATQSLASEASDISDELFFGISPDITSQWQFPLKVEPFTPKQGVFGAGRTSTRLHAGIDLYAPDGTEVFAMTGGKVTQIYLFYESLLAIEVENDDGTTIRYTELTPLVKVGDRVEQGQLIARLKKNSGGSCMLHLEIYATAGTGPLTQVNNKIYLYVPIQTKSYMRRSDLVDPGAVYQLPRP